MKLIFRSLSRYGRNVALAICVKLLGTLSELGIPYILEHLIDEVVPAGDMRAVILWGLGMFAAAFACRQLNVTANRLAIRNAHRVSWDIRQALFEKTMRLEGDQFDAFGLPSLISRMTSDSYNVQAASQQLQTLCVRSPIMLLGGVMVTLIMDARLALILVILLPFLIASVLVVSAKGLPVYARVQAKLDAVVRVMRENITGIRVVKALSKEGYEKRRFARANEDMTESDITAATVMAIPGPFMQLCLNAGLAVVVLVGAGRVDRGVMKPGVILSFLTYFNMIAMGLMGLGRIFMTMSRAGASADRIDRVLRAPEGRGALPEAEGKVPSGGGFIRFEHVDFSYGGGENGSLRGREKALTDISFTLEKGESLGIIGPTGSGKSTIVSLLMGFYEADAGGIFLDGRDVRCFGREELRSRFGAVFQNDMIFQAALRENIRFSRAVEEPAVRRALEEAMAADFVAGLEEGLDHEAAIRGADMSGGQKQRILVARALAADPEILVLDDSSSALDYRTDAAMRKAILEGHPGTTLILIAQRVSSVMNLTKILVMDDGRAIGFGTHEQLMASCPAYRETYEIQMGSMG